MAHSVTKCAADSINHLSEGEYREHEILIRKCNDCPNFIVDVRSDNVDGEYLAGYIDTDLVGMMVKAFKAIDKHEQDKLFLAEVPF